MKHRSFAKAVVTGGALLATTLLAGASSAQQFGSQFFAPDSTMWRSFGSALASDATTLVVGAPESFRNADPANCGAIGYGAIAIYKKVNGVWTYSQKFWHDTTASTNEIKFGWALSLRGNTLVVSAPREDSGSNFNAGAFEVFTRPSTTGSFSKLGTYFSPSPASTDRMGDISGAATNGSFIAVGEDWGVIHVYQLQSGVVSYRYDVTMPVHAPASGLFITDGGILVANLIGWPTLLAYRLTASSYSTVDVSALAVANAHTSGSTNAGAVAGDGNTAVALLNTDGGASFSTQVVNFSTTGVNWVDTRVIPTALAPQNGVSAGDHLSLKEGSGFFASFSRFDGGNGTTYALGYRYTANSGSSHDYNYQGTFLPSAYSGLAHSADPGPSLTFNGTDLVVADDTQTQGSGYCDFTSNGAFDTFTLGSTTATGPGASNELEPWITSTAALGNAVANYGSYAVSGSAWSSLEPGLQGQVTLFKRSTQWEALERYIVDSGEAFGDAVAINQHALLVGAPTGGANGTGTVYVGNAITNGYQHGLLTQTLPLPADSESGDYFGSSLSVDADTLLVGAELGGPAATRDGSAYVYTWNTSSQAWAFLQELQPPSGDVAPWLQFGETVGVSGDWAVVGAPLISRNGIVDAGAVYVYHRVNGSFVYVQRLMAPTLVNDDAFGQSLAISGSSIAASGASTGVHLFHLSGSTFVSDGAITVAGGLQYAPVALSSSGLVVATQGDARVRRYTRSGTNSWPLAGTLSGPTGQSFGSALAIQGTNVFIGAEASTVGGFMTGAGFAIQFGSF